MMEVASKSRQFLVLVFLLVQCSQLVKCANILALMGCPSPSHHLWNTVLLNALAEKGHNLTILSVDLPRNPKNIPKNTHYIHLEQAYDYIYNSADETIDLTEYIEPKPFITEMKMFYNFATASLGGIIRSKGLKTLLDYPNDFKFDLVIYDHSLGPVLLGFVHRFNYPSLIGVSPFLNPPNTVDIMGGHYYTSYIPFYTELYDVDMSFTQRVRNTAIFLSHYIYRRFIIYPAMDKMTRPFFPDMPYIEDIMHRTVLALVNSHPGLQYPEPLPPNVIEVGGLQNLNPMPLPSDIEKFINTSKKGFILFSLGTNMKSEYLGMEKIKIILDSMKSLPDYNFLWKFDMDTFDFELPSNILIRPFFPQKDILGHPKIKVFVTHSGGLSTQEATWHGVPMVGIPLFVDQHRNLFKCLLWGTATKVDYKTLSVNNLRKGILEILQNSTYRENTKIQSQRYRDRPMHPLDTALWWVEYILRNPSPEHFRSPTLKQGYFVSNSIDILFCFFSIMFTISFLLLKIILFCLCSKKKFEKKVSSDKKRKRE